MLELNAAYPRLGPKVSDTFTRADSTTTLGSAETGQAWTAGTGTWGISSNQMYSVSATTHATAYVEAGMSDNFVLSADITTSPTTDRTDVSLIFRAADQSNNMQVTVFDLAGINAVRVVKRTAGTFTTLSTSGTYGFTANTTYRLAIAVQDNQLTITVNGEWWWAYPISAGDMTTFGSNTKVGVRINRSAGGDDGGTRVDNLTVTPLAGIARAKGDYNGATVFHHADAFTLTTGVNLREQDSIIYDPGDPNLGTNPERLYKFYFSDGGIKVMFSADGVNWTSPQSISGYGGLREDPSVVLTMSPRGQVYRDGNGYMWMYAENSGSTIDCGYSTDGIAWTDSGSNPVIGLGAAASWEDALTGSPTALHDGTNFLVVYEGATTGLDHTGIAYGVAANALTKSPNNPIWDATVDPFVNDSVIVDAWYLNDDGTKFVFTCHDGRGSTSPTKRMFRGTTTNLTPTSWASGDLVAIKTNEPLVRNDFTVDYSTPGVVAFVTGNDADTALIRVSMVPVA